MTNTGQWRKDYENTFHGYKYSILQFRKAITWRYYLHGSGRVEVCYIEKCRNDCKKSHHSVAVSLRSLSVPPLLRECNYPHSLSAMTHVTEILLTKPFADHRNLQQSSRHEKMCSTWDPLQCKAFFNKNDKKTGKDKVLCHIPQGLALHLQIRASISQFASDRWRISKRNDPQRFSGRVTASRGWHGLIDARSFNTLLRDFSRKKISLTQQVTKTIRQWSTRFKF